jgi:hypothetical protein
MFLINEKELPRGRFTRWGAVIGDSLARLLGLMEVTSIVVTLSLIHRWRAGSLLAALGCGELQSSLNEVLDEFLSETAELSSLHGRWTISSSYES